MPSSTPDATPIRRGRIGTNVLLQILLGLILFGVVNYLSFRHYKRWDLTQTQEYTLSEKTVNYLESLEQNAKLTVIFGNSSPILRDVRVLTDQYKRSSNGKLSVEFIDPARSPDAVEAVVNEYGTQLPNNTIIVEAGDRARFLEQSDLANIDAHYQSRSSVIDFHGEDAITSALISVTESAPRILYYVRGKGAPEITAAGSADAVLEQLVRKQNIKLKLLDFATAGAVPEDASGVVIFAPQSDFTRAETAMLSTYWEDEQGSILVFRDPFYETPILDRFLSNYGITPRNDRVLSIDISPLAQRKIFTVQCNFVPVEDLPITTSLIALGTELSGQSSSLQLSPREKFLKDSGILVNPLLEATGQFWGETLFAQASPKFDEGRDTGPPVYIAAAAERGAARDARIRIKSSRLVVVANATLLDPENYLANNENFVANSINWLLDREELIGIAPLIKKRYKLDITEDQRSKIFLLTTIILPASVFCFGLFVWSSRRS